MTLILKDGRKVKICRLGIFEVVKIDGEEIRRYIGRPNIKIEDIERVE